MSSSPSQPRRQSCFVTHIPSPTSQKTEREIAKDKELPKDKDEFDVKSSPPVSRQSVTGRMNYRHSISHPTKHTPASPSPRATTTTIQRTSSLSRTIHPVSPGSSPYSSPRIKFHKVKEEDDDDNNADPDALQTINLGQPIGDPNAPVGNLAHPPEAFAFGRTAPITTSPKRKFAKIPNASTLTTLLDPNTKFEHVDDAMTRILQLQSCVKQYQTLVHVQEQQLADAHEAKVECEKNIGSILQRLQEAMQRAITLQKVGKDSNALESFNHDIGAILTVPTHPHDTMTRQTSRLQINIDADPTASATVPSPIDRIPSRPVTPNEDEKENTMTKDAIAQYRRQHFVLRTKLAVKASEVERTQNKVAEVRKEAVEELEELRGALYVAEQRIAQLMSFRTEHAVMVERFDEERDMHRQQLIGALQLKTDLKSQKEQYSKILKTFAVKSFCENFKLRKSISGIHQVLTDLVTKYLAERDCTHPSDNTSSFLVSDLPTQRSEEEKALDEIARRKHAAQLGKKREKIVILVDSLAAEMDILQALSEDTIKQNRHWRETANTHFKRTIALSNKVTALKTQITESKNKVTELEAQLSTKDTTISTLQQRLNDSVTQISERDKKRISDEKRIAEKEKNTVNALIRRAHTLRRQVRDLEQHLESLEKRKTRLIQEGVVSHTGSDVRPGTGLSGGGIGMLTMALSRSDLMREVSANSDGKDASTMNIEIQQPGRRLPTSGVTASMGRLNVTLPLVPLYPMKHQLPKPGTRPMTTSAPSASHGYKGVTGMGVSAGLRYGIRTQQVAGDFEFALHERHSMRSDNVERSPARFRATKARPDTTPHGSRTERPARSSKSRSNKRSSTQRHHVDAMVVERDDCDRNDTGRRTKSDDVSDQPFRITIEPDTRKSENTWPTPPSQSRSIGDGNEQSSQHVDNGIPSSDTSAYDTSSQPSYDNYVDGSYVATSNEHQAYDQASSYSENTDTYDSTQYAADASATSGYDSYYGDNSTQYSQPTDQYSAEQYYASSSDAQYADSSNVGYDYTAASASAERADYSNATASYDYQSTTNANERLPTPAKHTRDHADDEYGQEQFEIA